MIRPLQENITIVPFLLVHFHPVNDQAALAFSAGHFPGRTDSLVVEDNTFSKYVPEKVVSK